MSSTQINNVGSTEKKYPILITISFFIITSLISFFYHDFWTIFDQDGLMYLSAGQQILEGRGNNISLLNAGPAGPILFALLEDITQDGLFATQLVSIFSGTSIVFFSYYAFRNIFNYKIALLSQLFIAFNPWIGILSTTSQNDLTPIALCVISIYFITKNKIRFSYIIIAGAFLGLGFMFRTQPVIFFIAIIFFLIFIKKNKKFKLIGIKSGIERLAEENLQIGLAISLHAPNNELRKKLVPTATPNSVEEIIDAGHYYFKTYMKTG